MSSILDQVKTKDVAEKPLENTESLKDKNYENSSNKETSLLKRDTTELIETPSKTKKARRIDKFQQESEALLKTFGLSQLNEGPDSEKRVTRSKTRGTPTTPVIFKPETKQTSKRGRKSSEKKEIEIEQKTPKRDRGKIVKEEKIKKLNLRNNGSPKYEINLSESKVSLKSEETDEENINKEEYKEKNKVFKKESIKEIKNSENSLSKDSHDSKKSEEIPIKNMTENKNSEIFKNETKIVANEKTITEVSSINSKTSVLESNSNKNKEIETA